MWKAGRTDVRHAEDGYTYATVLIALVALALGAQTASIPTSTSMQRAAEAELIHRGRAYARAVESYWRADPANPEFPPSLDALLDDPRQEGRRHIRRLRDPVIASEWRIIPADAGGIAGVSPASERVAFRRFDPSSGGEAAADNATYADWQFIFIPEDTN